MVTRALENRVAFVTANRTGRESRPGGTLTFTGRSQIVDALGGVLARARATGEAARAADLDLARSRDKWLTDRTPLFAARRPDFYRPLLAPVRPAARRPRRGAP
jgi:predicted amidohydrolase